MCPNFAKSLKNTLKRVGCLSPFWKLEMSMLVCLHWLIILGLKKIKRCNAKIIILNEQKLQ